MSAAIQFLTHEPEAAYHARRRDHLTSHSLADFRKCPLLFRRKQLGQIPDEDRPAYQLGRVTHKLILEGRSAIPHVFPHQIAFNLLPEIDVFLYNGYTIEEWKMKEETSKIMHAPDMAISATCVRVPVYIGHSEAVHVEFTHPMTAEDARRILAQAPGVKVQDDPEVSLYPQPWAVAGTDDVFVGRIRQDTALPNGLAFWVVADNLRKGAALNAVQIAEILLQDGQS